MKRSNLYTLMLFTIALPGLILEIWHIKNGDHQPGRLFYTVLILTILDIFLIFVSRKIEKDEKQKVTDLPSK